MKSNCYIWLILVVTIIFCSLGFAQDNGNHFVKSAGFDFNAFKGDQGKGLSVIAGTDIDQDGNKEFFVFDKIVGFTAYDAIKCFEATGDNTFQLVWEHRYTPYNDDEGHGLAIADLDEDGKQEILVCAEDAIKIYEWDGTNAENSVGLPSEQTAEMWAIPDANGKALIRQLRVANLDDDPEVEIVMGYYGEQGMYIAIASLPNKDLSNPEWKDEFVDDFIPWRMGGMEIGDFDGDGNMEIFTCNFQDAPTTRLYENSGADTYDIKFTTLPDNLILNPTFDDAFANPVFHDFDGDGDSEFVITDIHGKVFVITKASSNNFQDFGPTAWKFVLNSAGVKVNGFVRSGFLGDLDQDGKDDIYYNDYTAGGVLDLEYQRGPVTDPNSWISSIIYAGHQLIYGQIYPGNDLDGDGRGEIVIAGNGDPAANLQIIENQDATSVQRNNMSNAQDFSLLQNYPNPFNPNTRIDYKVPHQSHVKISVYNLMGEQVAVLLNESQIAGSYSVTWNGNNSAGLRLPTGLYFYKLQTSGFEQSRKMLFVQ